MKTSKTKICSKCLTSKSRLEFYKSRKAKDGLRSECKSCHKVKYGNKYNTYKRQWIKDNPSYQRKWERANPFRRKLINIKWIYNVSPSDFLTMLFKQKFSCADCKTHFSETKVNLDHDHHHCSLCKGKRSCGKPESIRALVCAKCNQKRARADRARIKKELV